LTISLLITQSGVLRAAVSDTATRPAESGTQVFADYFRCANDAASVGNHQGLPESQGFFTFGGVSCFGRNSGARPALANGSRPDVTARALFDGTSLFLPFDLAEVVTNLREERYTRRAVHFLEQITSVDAARDLYYLLRPLLSVGVRRHLQKVRLRGWERIAFPEWPVDTSVDALMRYTMKLKLQAASRRIPFIWFWPNGAPGCAMLTHDVEGDAGRDFCGALMDLDEAFGFKAAFQVIPEERGHVESGLVERLRARGFEVNLHDFNHDGYLFQDKTLFAERAALLNRHARILDCKGFRSGAMYREQTWYGAFEFSYDMSVPNAAHLEPQRGGCCTVMPYFVGRILELPLTTIQDYSLFHILGDYSTALWRRQIDRILANHGLVTLLTHPDYLIDKRARDVYTELLTELSRLRDEEGLWVALPSAVDEWWRSRQKMSLVREAGSWRVIGPGSERARVAYAELSGDSVVFRLADRQ
jgi:hypothetical protein